MDADNCALACGLVSASYIRQGADALASRRRQIKALLAGRRLPAQGWDEATIEMLLQDAALMDSNNFPGHVGVGEREARVACPLVARRHWRLAHGVGRSGDISAEQPKAAGSSLLAKLASALAGDALRLAGLQGMGPPLVLPLATGMALTSALLAAAGARGPGARRVVWSRIDQKTCLKAITAANLEPVVVPLRRTDGHPDQLEMDPEGMEAALLAGGGPPTVAALVTTTSCFAPRAADDVVAAAKLCARMGVPHIINNAYGVQSAALCAAVTAACRRGRVDAIVQSTDKNFMVPVGGTIVCAPAAPPPPPKQPQREEQQQEEAAAPASQAPPPAAGGPGSGPGRASGGKPARPAGTGAARAPAPHGDWLVAAMAKSYPGRASMAPALDLLITLLHWGAEGWRAELAAREDLLGYMREVLAGVAARHGERLLDTPGNPISLAMTLDSLPAAGGGGAGAAAAAGASPQPPGAEGEQPGGGGGAAAPDAWAGAAEQAGVAGGGGGGGGGGSSSAKAHAQQAPTFFGAMLWTRGVSGTRMVAPGSSQTVAGLTFSDYGSHCEGYGSAYVTAAAAVGTTRADADALAVRLGRAFAEVARRSRRAVG